jgi:hypothetical protein
MAEQFIGYRMRAKDRGRLLKTGQTTQYSSELDDGYYQKGLAKSYTVLDAGSNAGSTNIALPYLVSDTGSFTAATKTYADTGKCGVFKAAGGETIVISGAGVAGNNGVFTTDHADADHMVVTAGFANEADAPATTFKKREAVSNNVVIDNVTGLTWLRDPSLTHGLLGTGLLPWTGTDYDIFAFCAAANTASLGNCTDWRIPNLFELMSLTNPLTSALDATAFPNSISWTNIWSSTTYDDTDDAFPFCVVPYGLNTRSATNTAYSVMLVRG